jgi:hypothetical protein
VAVVVGCGGGGSSSSSAQAQARKSPYVPGGSAEKEAPKGASPVLREIYRQFPRPKPDPETKGAAAAIEAGEKACQGKTPLQVKEEFSARAKLSSEQEKMVAQLPGFEKSSARNYSFAAGQIGALVYEASLPAATAAYGYRGCVYSLAQRLERKLAPSGGGGG